MGKRNIECSLSYAESRPKRKKIYSMTQIENRDFLLGGGEGSSRKVKGEDDRRINISKGLYICKYENRIMELIKIGLKRVEGTKKSNGRGKYGDNIKKPNYTISIY
jgi:hypothetical protein